MNDLFGNIVSAEYKTQTKNESFVQRKKANTEHDYYATPPDIVHGIMDNITFIGSIWEPACGEGHISKVVESYGYNVFSSDIIDRGYGSKINFLKSNLKFDNIITNPPFNKIDSFLAKAKTCTNDQIVFIASTNLLKGKRRISSFLSDTNYPIKKILLLDTSLNYFINGEVPKNRTGFLNTCVVIFKKGYIGDITLNWIKL